MLTPESAGLYNIENNKKAIENGLKKFFPIETDEKTLSVKDVEFSDPDLNPSDWRDIQKAIINRKSISSSIKPTFVLKDKDGKVLAEKKVKIGDLPLLTNLDTFIVNGTQYNLPTQFRLKPGGYARRTSKGTPEVFINAKGKHSLRLFIDEDKKLLKLKIGQGSIPLSPILKTIGASEGDIKNILGANLYEINNDVDHDNTIKKAYKALFKKKAPTIEEGETAIKNYITEAELDGDVNKLTLGTPYKNIDKNMMLDATDHLIKLTRGDIEPINRESLIFKSVHSANDMLEEKLAKPPNAGLTKYKMKKKMLDDNDLNKIVDKNALSKAIEHIFTTSKLSRYASQTNPIAILNTPFLTTLLGEGGVHSPDAVPAEAKLLQSSHMGFLDISHTPESASSGISLNLALNTKKVGNELKAKVINVKNGNTEWKALSELIGAPLAFPGQFTKKGNKWIPVNKYIQAIINDDHKSVLSTSVKYMISSAQGMFDLASNTVPFLSSDQGNRGMTSAKMSEQAVSLVDPENPLVETVLNGEPLLDKIGDRFSIKAKTSGIIDSISDNNIIIKGSGGKIDHPIFRNIPLNDKTILDAKVKVTVGERIKKGDLLADSNFTKAGKYSYGVNLNTAYMPYLGFNHEDAAVITESAANKLRSLHMNKVSIPLTETTVADLEKYRAYFPFDITKEDMKRYDPDGILRIGEKVHPNDTIAATLSKNVLTGSDDILTKLKKSSVSPMKSTSTSWNKTMPGIITDKVKFRDHVDIYVRTEEPFKVGDKISGRHGNKHIVSKIISDDLAPITEHGEKIEIMVDPHGVPTRINPGQTLENIAGKVANLKGKPFLVENFSGIDYRKAIADELSNLNKKFNIKVRDNKHPDKVTIHDPATGANINNISVGKAYITKLKHQVDNKMSSRGINEAYTQDNQPIQGGGIGGQSIDKLTMNSLLGYNARNILQEMYSIKNNKNADYWRAIMHNEIPPAPTASYELNKFNGLLKSMGINTVSKGTSVKLSPLTDAQVLDMSTGEIPDPKKMLKGKGIALTPVKDGLFGEVAGGFNGTSFTHINVDEPFISPPYKDAVKSLLNLTNKELDKLINE